MEGFYKFDGENWYYAPSFVYTKDYVLEKDGNIEELDLDAMVHDYEYINGANRNFIKKWNADIRYIKNMEANGKGIRVFRFLILTLLGIFFVPYCYIKYKLN